MKRTLEQLRKMLRYAPPNAEHHQRLEAGREALKVAGLKLAQQVPETPELKEALGKLQEAYLWFRQAVEQSS